jgi:hypothetical protein
MDDYNHNAIVLATRSRRLSLFVSDFDASRVRNAATPLRHSVPLPLLDDDEDEEVEDLRLVAAA